VISTNTAAAAGKLRQVQVNKQKIRVLQQTGCIPWPCQQRLQQGRLAPAACEPHYVPMLLLLLLLS
jgi:hypothetical protein